MERHTLSGIHDIPLFDKRRARGRGGAVKNTRQRRLDRSRAGDRFRRSSGFGRLCRRMRVARRRAGRNVRRAARQPDERPFFLELQGVHALFQHELIELLKLLKLLVGCFLRFFVF